MHLGMPECHKPFLGHCEYDLWPSFQESLCPEHISYSIWCRNPKFGVVIPLGMVEWCIPFWVTLTLTLTSGLISRFFVLYYSLLSSNVSYARPIPLGAFVTCLWHFLFFSYSLIQALQIRVCNWKLFSAVSLSKTHLSLLRTGSKQEVPSQQNWKIVDWDVMNLIIQRERSGSVVECLTRDRRAAGLSLTGVTALWSLSKTHLS